LSKVLGYFPSLFLITSEGAWSILNLSTW
jgi:hypothetical protein